VNALKAGASAGELVPLADRLRYTQVFRAVLVAIVAGCTLALPEGLVVPAAQVWLATAGFAAAAAVGHGLWRVSGRRGGVTVFGAMLIVDGLYLAWASYATGGWASPLRYLILIHVAAVALLASYRTGLKLAMWHSILLWVVYQLEQSDILATPRASAALPGSELERLITFAAAFWLVAIATTSFSAVNERELRRRRFDMEALATLASKLEVATEPLAVADILLDGIVDTFDFKRAVLLAAREGGVSVIAQHGAVETSGSGPSPGEGSVVHAALERRDTLLVTAVDPKADALVAALLPEATNLVVVPLVADDEAVGVLVIEHSMRSGSRIERRVVSMVKRFASHGALALRNAWLLERVQKMADTDALTRVANRRTFDSMLSREISRASRSREDVALVMFDIDHFKSLNDAHGHQAGDEVLRRVAAILDGESRDFDTVARYGGEEFAVILPRTTVGDAREVAERFLEAIRRDPAEPSVTASAGVASFPVNALDPAALVSAADEALYESKHLGRDRVTASGRWTADVERFASQPSTEGRVAGEVAADSRGTAA